MKVETYKCDICSTVKGDQNHWFRVTSMRSPDTDKCYCVIADWYSPSQEGEIHACGDSCVQKAVQAWLDERKAEGRAE